MKLTIPQHLKLQLFERGLEIDNHAKELLTQHGSKKLISRDYATTGGLTLILENDIYVNCPVGDWYCDDPAGRLTVSDNGNFEICTKVANFPVQPLPLPGYLSLQDKSLAGVMTHADRVRLSPIKGCICSCKFCDWPLHTYKKQESDVMLHGLSTACADTQLPPKHILISGGSPRPGDEKWLNGFYERIARESSIPVDIMLMPRSDDSTIERLVAAGIYGFSINIELFDSTIANELCPQKNRIGLASYEKTIRQAVKLTGGKGRVRSLLLVGPEPPEKTLQGVEFIASLGADPVLSPFRPAPGTGMADLRPPSADIMETVFLEAAALVKKYGVKLGPRCIPCMHNTVTFPDGTPEYFFS